MKKTAIPIGHRKRKLKIDWEDPEPPPPTFWQRVKRWFKELPIWSIK